MYRPVVLLASLLALACGRPTPTPIPAGGTTAALTAEDLRTRLFIFADDSMLGRESGTTGNVKATDYIARELARMGLEPAGENGTFFQTIPLLRFANDSVGAGGARAGLQMDGEVPQSLALWTDYAPAYSSRF